MWVRKNLPGHTKYRISPSRGEIMASSSSESFYSQTVGDDWMFDCSIKVDGECLFLTSFCTHFDKGKQIKGLFKNYSLSTYYVPDTVRYWAFFFFLGAWQFFTKITERKQLGNKSTIPYFQLTLFFPLLWISSVSYHPGITTGNFLTDWKSSWITLALVGLSTLHTNILYEWIQAVLGLFSKKFIREKCSLKAQNDLV